MFFASTLLALGLLLLPARFVGATACDPNGADATAVAAAQVAVDTQCDCAGALSHGAYVSCVSGVVKDRVQHMQLPSSCGGTIKSCRAKSTCGQPGFVTCCRTSSKGKTTCSTKHGATACKAPRNGAACVGATPTCCDACAAGGCATTTTSTSTTSSTMPAVCGNFVVEGDETCDGDNDSPSAGMRCTDPGIPNKHRCARPEEPGACHRCCGMGIGFTTGLICLGDADCCGQCLQYPLPQGRRCTDCPGGQCCAKPGESCATKTCCPGDSCVSGTCCADTNAGCSQDSDCCSGSCDFPNRRCN